MTQSSNSNSGSEKNLDDLFKGAIGKQEFTPSPKVWRNLNWKLLTRELLHFNFINVPTLALVTATGGLILIVTLTYWALKPDGGGYTSRHHETAVQTVVPPPARKTIAEQPPSNTSSSTKIPAYQPIVTIKKPANPAPLANSIVKTHTNPAAQIASNVRIEKTVPVTEPAVSRVSTIEVVTAARASSADVQFLDPLVFSNFDLNPETDTLSFIRSGEVFKYVREKMPVPSFFSFDAGVAPELAVYRSNGSSTQEFNYWANASIAYHYSRFSIRTGFGVGYNYNDGIYKINYLSNDSVSYYKEVIGYYTDPLNPSKIIYITRNKAIYDSVTHIADDRSRYRYTYLQIPLLLGYNVFESPRFSIGIEAGPAFSFLINEKKAQPVIDIPGGRLIELEDNTPARTSTNWQLWARLRIEYQFTKNWGLLISPYYKYFLTSPMQSAETGNMLNQAFGLDVGIQYLFGRKSNKK